MTRRERYAEEAFRMIREDIGNERSEKEVWEAIAKSSDEELNNFINFPEIRRTLLESSKLSWRI